MVLQAEWGIKDVLALANVGALFAVVIYYLYTQQKRKSDQPQRNEPTSGELKPEVWHKRFDCIEAKIDQQSQAHIEAMRDLTKAINDLTMTLLRQGK